MYSKHIMLALLSLIVLTALSVGMAGAAGNVDTGQTGCYDNNNTPIACPSPREAFFGQDGNYITAQPAYQDNGNGTITDLNTGLMWQQAIGEKVSFDQAVANAASQNTGGYTDWRLPTIKELYSLIDFTGITAMRVDNAVPYIDTAYFEFEYGDEAAGERYIDAQYWSSTEYLSTTMNGNATVFGVNFADGRIKGYPKSAGPTGDKLMFVRYVRNGDGYGVNSFVDNGNGTITDQSTGLTWLQDDSGAFNVGSQGDGKLNWEESLSWCENLDYAGFSDWRLPDAKELQYIVDYTRSPATHNSAAIDPIFNTTPIIDEGGNLNFAFYWTGTTHLEGDYAVYVAFGEALGFMQFGNSEATLMDVHGAGAQRSDPKTGSAADYPQGHGPQGDVIRINNLARCVRGGDVTLFTGGPVDQTTTGGQGQSGQGQQGQQGQGGPGQQGQDGQGGPGGPGQQGQGGQGQQGPPQEAIDACAGLNQGDTCSFNTPQGTVSGTCQVTPQSTVACAPAGGPPGN